LFPEKWIGRGGPTAWPVRASDFYLWARLKSTGRVTEVSEEQNLQQRIQNGLEFSSDSGNHMKLKVDFLKLLFHIQGAVIRKPFLGCSLFV
jgi:hypothetical protein